MEELTRECVGVVKGYLEQDLRPGHSFYLGIEPYSLTVPQRDSVSRLLQKPCDLCSEACRGW